MVRGRHVPGLGGANEFHIDSPMDPRALGACLASALNVRKKPSLGNRPAHFFVGKFHCVKFCFDMFRAV